MAKRLIPSYGFPKVEVTITHVSTRRLRRRASEHGNRAFVINAH